MRTEQQRPDEPWLDAAREALDAHAETLPPGVETRLHAMRREVLDDAPAARPASWLWRPAFAFVALFAVAVLWLPQRPAAPDPTPQAVLEDDAATAAELELLEDLEFVAWLEVAQGEDGAS